MRRLTFRFNVFRASLLVIISTGAHLCSAATFRDDVEFLRAHTDVVVLSDATGHAQVALAPRWQGRVLTSAADGADGFSFGWLNRELISAGKFLPHINVFGGEDRFWMGPEGGQFSIFFEKGAPFDLEHWHTPAPFDTEPYQLVSQSFDSAEFAHTFALTNYSGTRFDVSLNRKVRLLSAKQTWQRLDLMPLKNVKTVGFESMNQIRNAGKQAWQPATGLLSAWILGQFIPSPETTVVIPIRHGSEETLGRPVNSDYFGEVPGGRLVVKDDVVYFKADGKYRSKIGINPRRSRGILGSYDAKNKILTIVQFGLRAGETNYVNSKWEMQKLPFDGDAANSYNDGPPAPGAKPLGPFYELESSSPAAALAPGQSTSHTHRTIHLQGSEEDLDKIARRLLGTGLGQIRTAFSAPARGSGLSAPIDLCSLLREMISFDAVARWPAYTSHHASSYDRRSKTPADEKGWFANEDWSQFIREENRNGRREWVLMDAEGPGCVVRQWWGGMLPKGTLRFYFDNEPNPEIEGDARSILIGGALVGKPLAIENAHGPPGASGGMNLFLPLPFAKHCKITWDGPNWRETKKGEDMRWYNIEYRLYPPGTRVETFRKSQLEHEQRTVLEVQKALGEPPNFSSGKLLALAGTIAPQKEKKLRLASGPAAVRWIELKVDGADPEKALRGCFIECEFDGVKTARCPVGDFFGSGLGLNPYTSWYRTVAKEGSMTCRWVMPYRKSGRITLRNESDLPIQAKVSARTGPWNWDQLSMHFHSDWRRESIPTRPFRDWNYITVKGQGVYAGDTLALFNPVKDWWGEGDEKIWVDRESFPSHFGTGSEDYYGYSYGNPTRFDGPFSAQPRADGPGNQGNTTNTRTRNLDAIPFRAKLKVDLEIWHWKETQMDYAVATYWYGLPGAVTEFSGNAAAHPD